MTSTLRSMTGVGRAHRDLNSARITCEVRTLNQKGLDIKVRLPHGASLFEPKVVSAVKGAFERGRVDVTFDLHIETAAADAAAVRGLVEQARALASSLGVAGDVTPGDLLRALAANPRREPSVDVEAAGPTMKEALDAALDACVAARVAEGAAIHGVLDQRIGQIEKLAGQLRERTADAPKRLAEKLRARLEGVADVDPTRVAQEAALLADRVDVTEELERLAAHVGQGRALLSTSSPGRKLDFLCQELLREANTLGSKCQDAAAAHVVVDLKAEIEKLREQVQNVE